MDLSPKLLTDVQFREQWRGYNPDEVDDFLERVASGVEELQRRLNDALERAAEAEHRLVERSDEDEIRRTLVLAQRTADASVEEARIEADRLLRDAEARARETVAAAEARLAELDDAVNERRRAELGGLAAERAALEADVEQLRRFVSTERERLAALLQAQLDAVERDLTLPDEPELSDVALPAPPAPEAPVEMRAAETIEAPAAPIEAVVDEPRAVSEVDELAEVVSAAAAEPAAEAEDEAEDDASAHVEDPEPEGEVALAEAPRPSLFDDAAAEDLDSLPEPVWRDEGPATQAMSAIDDDDPFLAELRQAMSDTEPLGPREHDLPLSMHHDDDDRNGFFRRGRRRG